MSGCRVKKLWTVLWLLGVISFVGCINPTAGEMVQPMPRPSSWAVPLREDGVKNLYRVDQKLYRSAQPGSQDFEKLYEIGIRYSLNLRKVHSDKGEIGQTPIEEYRIPIFLFYVDYQDLVKAVRFIVRSDAPVLVHCFFGSDRTGSVIAAYRIAVQGWSKEKAIEEMIEGGYGYHTTTTNLSKLLRSLDVKQFHLDVYR